MENKQKYCMHCGEQIIEETGVCPECGKKKDGHNWSSFEWYINKKGTSNYLEKAFDWVLGKLSFALNVVLTVSVVVTASTVVKVNSPNVSPRFNQSDPQSIDYAYVLYARGEIDTFNYFASNANDSYDMPHSRQIYQTIRDGESLDYQAHFNYDGAEKSKSYFWRVNNYKPDCYKLVGVLEMINIKGKYYVVDDRKPNQKEIKEHLQETAQWIAKDYANYFKTGQKGNYSSFRMKLEKTNPCAEFFENNNGDYVLIALVDSSNEEIQCVYVGTNDQDLITPVGKLGFTYIDTNPYITSDEVCDLTIAELVMLANNEGSLTVVYE